jgi:uncharacterized membrane protein
LPRIEARHAFPRLALLLAVFVGLAYLPVAVHADSLADLTVDSIWLEDASQPGQPVSQISPGQSFLIVATVKNIGQATAPGFYLDVYYDNDYGRGGPDNILAGEVQTWYVGPLTATNGTHTTKWVVDPDNQIAELSESNNERDLTFTIGSSPATTSVTSTLTSSTTESYSTTSTSTTTSCVITVLTKNADGSALGGVQVTFGSQNQATDPSGTVQFSVPAGTYSLSSQSSLTGGSGVQHVFAQWSDGDTSNTKSITVSGSATYEARYKTQYQLTISTSPSGAGSTSPAVGSYWYDSGQTVSIQVSPASGYSFSSWTGSGPGSYSGAASAASVTMNGPIVETATLTKPNGAAISGVTFLPNPALQGSAMAFTITIQNLGKTSLSSLKVQLAVYAPDGSSAGSGTGSISKLAGGSKGAVRISYTVPASAPTGTWTFVVSLYQGTSLLDQRTDGTFTVNQAIIAGSIVSVSDSPDPVARGRTVGFTVTVKNTGNIAWSSTSVTVKIYGPDGKLFATPVLAAGSTQPGTQKSYTVSWKVPSNAQKGLWRYEVYVNYGSVLIGSSTDPTNTFKVN